MKKKLLVSVVLFVSLFVSVLCFAGKSKAVNLDDPELELTASEQKDILSAYDLDHNGKLTARDVTKMKQNNYSNEEIRLVQRCLVHDVQFIWQYKTVNSLSDLFNSIKNHKFLYVEHLANEKKIVLHLQTTDRVHDFVNVTYTYGNYGIYFY